ncbi:unnamed protein product, partial [marine sediment metagenome]
YSGETTAGGGAGGSSLICSGLTTQPDFDGNQVVITSGDYKGQARDINGVTTGGTVTPHLNFGGVIVEGTKFIITAIRVVPAEVAAIEAKLDHASHGLAALKALIDALEGKLDRQLFSMDFWSDPMEEIQLAAAAGTKAITPTVTIADLPADATIVRAIAMLKFRMIENTNAVNANNLDGGTVANTSQVIQVKETAAGSYTDAIKFVDTQFGLAKATREGGDVLIGSIDITSEVDGNDSYTFQWLLAKAAQDNLNFNDCAVGLR